MAEILKERRTKVEGWRASGAVESGVTWKAASAARGFKAEVGHSDVLEVDVNWKATRKDQSFECSVENSQKKKRGALRKETAETQDCVSCQDMEVDDNKSLEEMGFVPSAAGELLRVTHMCDKKGDERGFKFCELAAVVTEEGGTKHTINLHRNCLHRRRTGQGRGQQRSLEREDQTQNFSFLETGCGSFWVQMVSFKKCWSVSQSREHGPGCWKWQKKWCSEKQAANWQRVSLFKEELELLREVRDLRFDGSLMRPAFSAGKAGDCADFFNNDKRSPCGQVCKCESATVRWSK